MTNKFIDRSNYKRVPASGLKLGMFVAELDRPWLETPFLLQGFTIKTLSEIRKLREYCQYVYVDQGGQDWGAKKNPFNTGFQPPKRKLTENDHGLNVRGNRADNKKSVDSSVVRLDQPEHPIEKPAEEEHQVATQAYRAAHSTVSGLLDQARLGMP